VGVIPPGYPAGDAATRAPLPDRAQRRGDSKTVRSLQRLLMKSRSAKLLAIRRVTQDNRGKATAGVDGGKALTPGERLELADTLVLASPAFQG
jgi:RNA-directed DNA polymerase